MASVQISGYMPNMFTEVDLETMQWVRGAFNPKGLANPGKIFPAHLWGSCNGSECKFESVERFLDEPEFNSTSAESQRHSGDAVGTQVGIPII